MAGTFEGSSELEWKLYADLLPAVPMARGCGMPHTPFLKIVNPLTISVQPRGQNYPRPLSGVPRGKAPPSLRPLQQLAIETSFLPQRFPEK
jgi:hypothetical protein